MPPFGQPPPGMAAPSFPTGLPPTMVPPGDQLQQQITTLQSKINVINEQLHQSEKNLKAQEDFLTTKKKVPLIQINLDRNFCFLFFVNYIQDSSWRLPKD